MDSEKVIASTSAAVGGFVHFVKLQVHTPDISFMMQILKAGTTAAICGLIGLLVKDGYTLLKEKIKRK